MTAKSRCNARTNPGIQRRFLLVWLCAIVAPLVALDKVLPTPQRGEQYEPQRS